MRGRSGSPGREGREGQASCAGPSLQSGEEGRTDAQTSRAQGGRECPGGGPGQVPLQGTCQAGGGGLGTLGAAEGPLPKTRPPGRPSRRPSPALRQPHPSVRGCPERDRRDVGSWWAQSSVGTAPCLWPACGHRPPGAWEPGQCGGRQPRNDTLIWGHRLSLSGPWGSVCSRREGPVFAHPPLPYTRPDRSWRVGRGPGWDAGEPRFTGPNAARRQSPVCQQDNWRRFSLLPQPGVRGRGGRLPHRPRRTCT